MSRIVRFWALIAGTTLLALPLRSQTSPVREYRRAHEHEILAEFLDLLAIPNIAADAEGIRKNADLITRMMEKRGFAPQLLYGSDRSAPPLIYGERTTPGATRTNVFYAHYDGQPTDPAKWTGSEPWKPV